MTYVNGAVHETAEIPPVAMNQFADGNAQPEKSIEALCKLIAGDSAADLAKALKAITRKVVIHPALAASLEKLYVYTSDGHGIRHALKDENSVDCEDAQFMLVTCSAFIN